MTKPSSLDRDSAVLAAAVVVTGGVLLPEDEISEGTGLALDGVEEREVDAGDAETEGMDKDLKIKFAH